MQVLMEWIDAKNSIALCVTRFDGKKHAIRVQKDVSIGTAMTALEDYLAGVLTDASRET